MARGEYHAYNPDVVSTLQTAVKTGETSDYQSLRSKLMLVLLLCCATPTEPQKADQPLPLEQVEPSSDIFKRFRLGSHVDWFSSALA
ncbi:hypothetical protein O9992_11900 [Vibrio lentus]|nr:hypothetical protein [Vibrio lentus]